MGRRMSTTTAPLPPRQPRRPLAPAPQLTGWVWPRRRRRGDPRRRRRQRRRHLPRRRRGWPAPPAGSGGRRGDQRAPSQGDRSHRCRRRRLRRCQQQQRGAAAVPPRLPSMAGSADGRWGSSPAGRSGAPPPSPGGVGTPWKTAAQGGAGGEVAPGGLRRCGGRDAHRRARTPSPWWVNMTLPSPPCEHRRHCDAIVESSLDLGVHSIFCNCFNFHRNVILSCLTGSRCTVQCSVQLLRKRSSFCPLDRIAFVVHGCRGRGGSACHWYQPLTFVILPAAGPVGGRKAGIFSLRLARVGTGNAPWPVRGRWVGGGRLTAACLSAVDW